MEILNLKATSRDNSGKGVARKLRAVGRIPAVFYLGNEVNKPISIDRHELEVLLAKRPTLIRLNLDETEKLDCIVRERQDDPVTGRLVHIDLLGVKSDVKVKTQITVHLIGTPIGLKQGGLLEQLCNHIEIECLPADIPDALEVDVSGLELGETLHLSSVSVQNVTFLADPDTAIATVALLKAQATAVTSETTEESTEPEEEQN